MKLLYKPFAMIAGAIGARVGESTFKALWEKIDGAEPPSHTSEQVSLGKAIAAKALEAATLAGFATASDRASRRSFKYLFGIWPGEKRRDARTAARE